MKRGLALILSVMMVAVLVFALASCGDTHEHTFSDKWEIDENNHWHKATCEHTDAIASKGGHVDEDEDGACDMCGNGEVHMHKYTDAWTSDETGHWHMATCDGCTDVKGDVYKHFNENGDGACDLCGYAVCYSVTVNAPEVVDAPAVVYVDKTTGTATFEVSVSDLYVLSATGATQKGDVVTENGENVYTYELADIKADGEVTLATKQVKFVELISENTETVALTGSWMGLRGTKEITLTLEKGNYMLVGSAEGGLEISFMDEIFMDSSKLEVEEAGEVKVILAATDYDSGNFEEGDEVEVEYSVLAVPTTDVAVEELEGEGLTFPTNINMYLTFTAPEAGMYIFTSEAEGVIWNDDISLCVAYAAEAGAELTVFVTAREIEGYSYEFDWKVEKLTTSGTVVDGDTVTLTYGKYTVVEFTATEAGTYSFSALNMNTAVEYYDYEYGWMASASWSDIKLEANEKITLYIVNPVDTDFDGADTIEDTFVVSSFTPALPKFTVTVTETYAWDNEVSFTSTVNGTYTFNLPAGLGFMVSTSSQPEADYYENEYGTSVDVSIPADTTITIYVASTTAGDYEITYSVVEETPLEIGANTIINENVTFAYTATEAGTLTLTSQAAAMGMVEISYAVNGGDSEVFELESTINVNLGVGDKITITVISEGYSGIGAVWTKAPADANGLTGTYTIDYIMPSAIVLTFSAATDGATEGVLTVVDNISSVNSGTYTYTITDGNYSFKKDGEDTSEVMVMKGFEYWSFQNASLRIPQDFAPIAAESGNENTVALAIDNNAIDGEDITFEYTATEAGTLKLTAGAAIMGMVEISYTVNGGDSTVLELSTSVELTLDVDDVVVITVVAEGSSSITAEWTAAE